MGRAMLTRAAKTTGVLIGGLSRLLGKGDRGSNWQAGRLSTENSKPRLDEKLGHVHHQNETHAGRPCEEIRKHWNGLLGGHHASAGLAWEKGRPQAYAGLARFGPKMPLLGLALMGHGNGPQWDKNGP